MKLIKNTAIVTLVWILLLPVSSCKKGEDDPALSLRSRKARVEGEWKASQVENTESYTKEYTGGADSTSVSSVKFDGNVYTSSFEVSSETDMEEKEQKGTAEGTAQFSYTLDKNGNFTYIRTTDLTVNITESGSGLFLIPYTAETAKTEKITTTIRGKWSFLGGNDETKNKSSIAITYIEEEVKTESKGQIKYYYSNKDTTLFFDINNIDYISHNANDVAEVWNLEKLANKEMVVTAGNSSSGYGNLGYNDDTENYTVTSLTSARIILKQN